VKPLAHSPSAGQVSPVSLDDLIRYEVLDQSVPRSWERALETLQNRKDQLGGLAIASDTRVEAYVLFRDLAAQGQREIVALGGARALLEVVVRVCCQAGALDVTIPRISDEEIAWADLEAMGFQRGRTYTRYATLADSPHPDG